MPPHGGIPPHEEYGPHKKKKSPSQQPKLREGDNFMPVGSVQQPGSLQGVFGGSPAPMRHLLLDLFAPAKFALRWRYIVFTAAGACPLWASGQALAGKAGSPERCARLRAQYIGNHSVIAHGCTHPDTSAIQFAASVRCAVGAITIYLKGKTVV